MYDGFLDDSDRLRTRVVAGATEKELADLHPEFQDERLDGLLLHYKARSFPRSLSAEESVLWEKWRTARIQSQLPGFMKSIERISQKQIGESQQFILQELQLWLENIMPADTSEVSSPD